jgi:peptidyl-prolyl cis-trans isomerase B (cyclophilin B)
MVRAIVFVILPLIMLLSGCKESSQASDAEMKNEGEETMTNEVMYPQLTTDVLENEIVVEMVTNHGTITLKLFPEHAPKAVENFVTHSKNGYYNGLTFHRIIKDFMIQGGDPNGNGTGGESIWGEPFEDEFSKELFHLRGALSMANAGPNTNGSQFFIVQNASLDPSFKGQMEQAGFPKEIIEAYVENGGTPWLDFRHTVFGQVIAGMDVVDKIANVSTGLHDKPVEDVIIEKMNVVQE